MTTTVDTSTLTYVIEGFDQKNMVLLVKFPVDGTTANIGISSIPTTQDELDTLVKPFGTHLEVATTQVTAKSTDLAFLNSVVGKTNTTTRFSQVELANQTATVAAAQAATAATAAALPSNEFTVGEPQSGATLTAVEANTKAADLEYIKELIKEALAAQATAS